MILKVIGEIFVPLLPGVITASLCGGFASLLVQAVPDYTASRFWNLTYQILMLLNTSFMTYITAWAGYRAAERFGATPILGGMLGMITSLDGINQISSILGLYNDASPLDSVLRSGKGGILSVFVGALVIAFIEKKIRSIIPDNVDIIFTPLLTMLFSIILYVMVIMPLFGYISSGIVWIFGRACISQNIFIRAVSGYIAAAIFLPMVAAGMHHGLIALYSVQLQELGFVTLYPALAMAGAGQVGAALALWKKAKKAGNEGLCSVIAGALPAGFLGVGEPLIYGVTLPLGKPFLTAGLGAGFGGAFIMITQVASVTWGPSGLIGTFVMTAGKGGAVRSVLFYLTALVISYIGGYLITNLVFKEEELGSDIHIVNEKSGDEERSYLFLRAGRRKNRKIQAGDPLAQDRKKERRNFEICAPVDGELVPMHMIPDILFSSGVIGNSVGIMPESDEVFAPCAGSVSEVSDTGNIILFQALDGREVLLHMGIDTSDIDDEVFDIHIREGDTVSAGQKLGTADFTKIREAGFSPVVVTSLIN